MAGIFFLFVMWKEPLKLKTGGTIAESDWSSWLVVAENEDELTVLRRNIEKGLPYGNDAFIEKLEKYSNKSLKYRPRGVSIRSWFSCFKSMT